MSVYSQVARASKHGWAVARVERVSTGSLRACEFAYTMIRLGCDNRCYLIKFSPPDPFAGHRAA